MIIEVKRGKKWQALPDSYSKRSKVGIGFNTMPHNCLFEAHLLGACEVMDPGNAPAHLSHKLRITTPHRGLPEDVSAATKALFINEPVGAPNWVTLADILAFDWSKNVNYDMWINGPMLLKWNRCHDDREHIPPHMSYRYSTRDEPVDSYCELIELGKLEQVVDSICAGVSKNRGKVPNHELLYMEEQAVEKYAGFKWTRAVRNYPLYQVCNLFHERVMPQMLCGSSPQHVRIVAWVS
jgi:hypothetical protein